MPPEWDPAGIDAEVEPEYEYGSPGCGAFIFAVLVIGLLIYAVLAVAF